MENIKKKLDSKILKTIAYIILDVIALVFSSFIALGLRFDFSDIPEIYYNNLDKFIMLDCAIMITIFALFKLYLIIWNYASVIELVNAVLGCVCFVGFEYIYKVAFDISMPRSFYLMQLVILIICVGFIRFFFRIMKSVKTAFFKKHDGVRTMLVGAGDAGRIIINEVLNNPKKVNLDIACIIDDNEQKAGKYIRNIPIVGNSHDIERNCRKYDIEEIVIAMPSVSKEKISQIVEECQKTKCKVKILPYYYNTSNKASITKVRPLSYEDFLGRDEITVDVKEIASNIKDKTILVTGGGGSIGSELCRQIATCSPKLLIIFDIYENNAYDIQQELIRKHPKLNLTAIIGSVRDYDRLEKVFSEYKPELVFHAAAHKHVPLMEVSPNEAVKNNCLGTLNTVKLADKYKAEKFVLISTDKAVRPTNVMGATKRICEMIIQSYAKKSKTNFVAVRFGNVLGSNGSVIPLFIKQIDEGGPVTVTDKRITRFFMTIPEAVSLVLQASVYANGGEIFVLDMGEPVKIYDLAQKIIRFKGFEPDVDMKIKITGLRPGEKLYEEILMDEEGLKETPNKLIHIGEPIEMDNDKFLANLDKLIEASYKNGDDIKDKVAKIVDTYKVDKGEKKETQEQNEDKKVVNS